MVAKVLSNSRFTPSLLYSSLFTLHSLPFTLRSRIDNMLEEGQRAALAQYEQMIYDVRRLRTKAPQARDGVF